MTVTLSRHDDIAVLSLNRAPVNALSEAVRRVLAQRLAEISGDPTIRAVVLNSVVRGFFSAGADIRELSNPNLDQDTDEIPSLPTLIDSIEACPLPVVALIDGTALGGGLELALGCDYRLATQNASFGLPEITLGLIPGAGGTQRLPRCIGVALSEYLILSGQSVSAQNALRWGLIDAMVQADDQNAVLRWVRELLSEGGAIRRTCNLSIPPGVEEPPPMPRRLPGSQVARDAARQCIAAAAELYVHGRRVERKAFEQLRMSEASRALRHAFFAQRPAKSSGNSAPARPVNTVGLLGAGTMGRGIALCLANAGFKVLWFDARPDAVMAGLVHASEHFESEVKKGRLSRDELEVRQSLFTAVKTLDGLADADLVIEAVFEDLAVKREVFRELDAHMRPGAILATNTSTLDVDQIAASTSRPQDVVGLHFFSPAHVMRLLEVVRGEATAPDVLATAIQLGRSLRKVAIVSRVCDGFIGNRMWHHYLRQAAWLVYEGATPSQVDAAMREWGFAMGPFQVADLAGLDVGYQIRQHQYRESPQFPWPSWLDEVSQTGRTGLKGGAGIHAYPDGRQAVADREIEVLIEASARNAGATRREVTQEEIIERCVSALIVEAVRILEEGIAERASDIDAVFLSGYGFPPLRGGPCFAADMMGLEKVIESLQRHTARAEPDFWRPPALLLQLAGEARQLHQYTSVGAPQ